MKIINQKDTEFISISTSKGNQTKFKLDDVWYKKDLFGYEAAAEEAVSDLLKQSNLSAKDYVIYNMEKLTIIGYKRSDDTAVYCKSNNFLTPDDRIVTVAEILDKAGYKNLNKTYKKLSLKEKIEFTVNLVEESTGLDEFGKYLTTLFELDAFVYNEDRHLNNIAVIESRNGDFRYCPIFDNGAAFMSDIKAYKLTEPVNYVRAWVEAKPFNKEFDNQARIARALYGPQLKFSKNLQLSDSVKDKIRENYGEQILFRIEDTIEFSKRKYKDMISCVVFKEKESPAIELENELDIEDKRLL